MNSLILSAAESRLWRRASQYLDAGQVIAAQAALESLVQRVPHEPAIRMKLARVMLDRGLMRSATSHWLQLAKAPLPDDLQLVLQLVQCLCHVGEVGAARACLDHLEALPDVPAEQWAALAHSRSALGEIAAARAAIDRALTMGVDTPDEYYLQAALMQYGGDMLQAQAVLEGCLRRWPFYSGAAMALSKLRKQTPVSNHLDAWQERLRRIPAEAITDSDNLIRAEFGAALFKEFDDLGRFDEAWASLATSNVLMHALNPYDAAIETAVTDALITHSAGASDRDSDAAMKLGGPIPIFIVGLPRSGTTLLERMLSNHSEVVSAGEISDFLRQFHWATDTPPGDMVEALERGGEINHAELGRRYLQQTQWRAVGCKYYIDKLPANVQMVSFIRKALPQAVILHMVRDPMQVCFSNFRAMFGNTSAYSYDLHALAHYHGQYERLAACWRVQFPEQVLDVGYEHLVATPEAGLRQVLEHCGLTFEESCLRPEGNTAPVATPSSIQVREPIHMRSVAHWRNYAEPLEPLRIALEANRARARALG